MAFCLSSMGPGSCRKSPGRLLPGIATFLLTAAALALSDAARTGNCAEERGAPNIILILTDDQGYGDLGRNGNRFIKTPNLDKFYDEAVRFEDFHVSPTCAPTRSSIMTGRHEFRSASRTRSSSASG